MAVEHCRMASDKDGAAAAAQAPDSTAHPAGLWQLADDVLGLVVGELGAARKARHEAEMHLYLAKCAGWTRARSPRGPPKRFDLLRN